MKWIVSIVLMGLLSFAAGLFFPWWSIAAVCFLIAVVIPMKPWQAFIAGVLALFLLWGGMAYFISLNNENILAHKISLIMLKKDDPYLLILITALIGAIIGGLSAMAGSLLRKQEQSINKKTTFQ